MRSTAADLTARLATGARQRPLQTGLAALVAGLLCAGRWPLGTVALAAVLAGGCLFACLLHLEAVSPRRRTADGAAQPEPAKAPRMAPDGDEAAGDLGTTGWSVGQALGSVGLVVVLGIVGAVVSGARIRALETTHFQGLMGRRVTERVVVQEAPRASRFGGWSAVVTLRGEPVLLRMTQRGASTVQAGPTQLPDAGAVLAVTGRLVAPSPFAQVRHAHAELRADRSDVIGRRGGPRGVLDRVRQAAERALDRGLPPDAAGLLRGMVLGQDTALPVATRDAFRAAGLSHLVAASGTNVVLLAALATVLGTALGLGLSGRLWFVLATIAAYVPLAGGGASIQRAGVMGAAAVAAGLVGRPASRWWGLGLAAAVTLVLDPRAERDPGWQLSFAAVLAILGVGSRGRERLVRLGVPGPLAEVATMTLAATVATAPLVAAHFGQASLVGVPVNLLVAPAVAPIMWLGVAAAAVGQLVVVGGVVAILAGATADALDALAGFPLGYITWLARTAASLPGAVLHVGPLPVLVACVGVAGTVASRRMRRLSPLAALGGVALLLGLEPERARPPGPPAGLRVTLLDVGQGDATLLQDGGRAVLVDAGPPDDRIVALLQRAGIRKLDLLVVTHAQADHLGSAAAVVAALPVGMVLDGRDGVASVDGDRMGALALARGIPRLAPHAGQLLHVGPLRIRVLWPRLEPPGAHAGVDPNERAIVLEAEGHGARVLLTADAESDVLARLDLRPVDVLKVSHHGSDDPGLPALLERLRPRVAAIEVGAHNTYGHPAPSTLAALSGVPVVVRTDRDGTVRLDRGARGAWEVRAHA